METKTHQLHIFIIPFFIKSHLITTIDMARLFASRGLKTTFLTTPYHANVDFSKTKLSSQQMINVISFKPDVSYSENGLPEGWESIPMYTRFDLLPKAGKTFAPQLDQLLQQHRPDCVLADMFFPWATDVAARHGIPRLNYNATGCFSTCTSLCLRRYQPQKYVSSDSDPFLVPNLPGDIKLTRNQLPYHIRKDNVDESDEYAKFFQEIYQVEERSYGSVFNSFYELEFIYADQYQKDLSTKTWLLGPVFLYDKLADKEANKQATSHIDAHDKYQYLFNWLNSKRPYSVVYACFGSLSNFNDAQLMEIALGLEASGQEFIWVVAKLEKQDADNDADQEECSWLPQGFEKRIEGKGLVVRGWAPQVKILEHQAVGGFLTHCGWNSIIEGIYAGLPMVTWPISADHFYIEKLVTQVHGIGIPVGAGNWAPFVANSVSRAFVGDFVRREAIEKAVRRMMVGGEETQQMRSRAKALGDIAKGTTNQGGSSYAQMDAFIRDLKLHKISP